MKTFGAAEGLQQTLGRLGEELVSMSKVEPFTISRTLDAPRDLVWKAWTEPDRLAQWFGPKGATITASNNDLRPGGIYHYGMRIPDGTEIWGKWIYREIVPPERLVFVTMFSDEKGGVTRHPFSPTWPLELLSTITFAADGDRTVLTIEWTPINATEEERKTFADARESMNGGWGGTLEQLTAYLANTRA